MHQAVDMRASERKFHPVRDYLDSLTWDGVPRMETCSPVISVPSPDLMAKAIGRMFLI